MSNAGTLLTRLAATIAIAAALYLVAANAALNLTAVRDLLNRVAPDTFSVTWKRAWSLYPLRIQLEDVKADGQTPTEQWQVDARRAAATVSLAGLLRGEIRIRDLHLTDIDVRLRPRSEAGAQPDAFADFFPVIRNRDPNAPAEPIPDDTGGGPALEIDDIRVRGEHAFWISHIRGTVPGAVRGSVRMEPEVGRLSLAGGALDLALTTLRIGPEEPMAHDASITGRIDVPPFVLSETEGLEFFRLPEIDAKIDLPVGNLGFLAVLKPSIAAMGLSGEGRLHGRLVLADGEARSGTDLVVEAHRLFMDLGAYDFGGDGLVEVKVDPDDESQADLVVKFNDVHAQLEPTAPAADDAPLTLFVGRGLVARLHAAEVDPTTTSTATRPEELASEVTLKASLEVPSVRVPDLTVYNRLFPEGWETELLGGTGTLNGALEIMPNQLSLDLNLASDDADLRHKDYRATADLLIALRARVDDPRGLLRLDLGGTQVRLSEAKVTGAATDDARGEPAPWSADLRVDEGIMRLRSSADVSAADAVQDAARLLAEQGFGALLARADGRLGATLTVSELDWIAAVLNRPMSLTIDGAGELDIDFSMAAGLPVAGTKVEVPRQSLALGLMQHRIDATGQAALHIEDNAPRPGLRLDVALDEGRMRRVDTDQPDIDAMRMDLAVQVPDAAAPDVDRAEVGLKIHSARIPNLGVYDAYLPPGTPVSVQSGTASLVGELRLRPKSAEGTLLLEADEARFGINRQSVSGNLRAELLIRDGAASDKRFDIGGSSIVLDSLRVTGRTARSTDPNWHARLQLTDAEVLWQTPMHLRANAAVTVKDVAPVLALLDNERGKHSWLEDMLAVEDIAGHLRLRVDGKSAVIEDAMLSAPEIGVHAKGRSDASGREAMVLLRWHNLSGAVEIDNDRLHFDVAGAADRYRAYEPGKTPLRFSTGSVPMATEDKPERPTDAVAPRRGAGSDAADALPAPRTPDSGTESPFLDHSL